MKRVTCPIFRLLINHKNRIQLWAVRVPQRKEENREQAITKLVPCLSIQTEKTKGKVAISDEN